MIDIFLYQGEPNPTDIRLRDPTQAGAGATIVEAVGLSEGAAYVFGDSDNKVQGGNPHKRKQQRYKMQRELLEQNRDDLEVVMILAQFLGHL